MPNFAVSRFNRHLEILKFQDMRCRILNFQDFNLTHTVFLEPPTYVRSSNSTFSFIPERGWSDGSYCLRTPLFEATMCDLLSKSFSLSRSARKLRYQWQRSRSCAVFVRSWRARWIELWVRWRANGTEKRRRDREGMVVGREHDGRDWVHTKKSARGT